MRGGKRLISAAAALSALIVLTPIGASAQSNEELLRIIRQQSEQIDKLNRRVESLEGRTSSAEQTADKAMKAAEASESSGAVFDWGPSPTISSPDGRFEMHVRGRIQADFGSVNDNLDGGQDRFATEFRRARLGIEGIAWKDVKYKFEMDFAGNSADITDAYLQYKGWQPIKLTFGQFKERVSLDEQTSSRHISVMERAAFTDAFGFQRRIGVGLDFEQGAFGLHTGIYGGGDISDNADDEGFAVAARAFFEPEIGNGGKLHVGASVRHRDLDNDFDGTEVRYRQRPFSHVSGTRYVNTDHLPDTKSDTFFGAELAGVFGPFWAAGEWGFMKTNIEAGSEGLYNGEGSLSFQGGYADIGWFLTGETRKLDGGDFGRPKVNNPVFEGGWGALALAARVDWLDLNDGDAGVIGGEQVSYIIGLSWYLNRHTRIMLNYAHTDIDNGLCDMGCNFGAAEVNADGKASIDAVTGRFQVDW